MTRQTRWVRVLGGMEHPDDTMLLAYARQQNLGEDWPGISQHITYCKQCSLRCNELMDTGALLTETLAHFQRSQYYPSLVGGVLESIQNPAAARSRRQKYQQAPLTRGLVRIKQLMREASVPNLLKPGVRRPGMNATATLALFSISALLALLLLAVAIALAFSVATSGVLRPFQPSNTSMPVVTQPRLTVPAHSSAVATVRPGNGPANNGSPAVPATGTPAPGRPQPALRLCTTGLDRLLARIRLCGSNFPPGDKLELIAQTPGSNSRIRHVTVNTQGAFQDSWSINTCNSYPIAISVIDLTHPAEVVPELQRGQLGQCSSVPFSISVVWPGKHY